MSAQEPMPLEVNVPIELEDGVYANFLLVHHTEYEFTLDFCQMQPQPDRPPRVKVVSRIRISPGFIGQLLQAISQNAFRRDENMAQIDTNDPEPEEFDDPDQ
jgi:hypothetical protein